MVVLHRDSGQIKVRGRAGESWRPECLGVMKMCYEQSIKIMAWIRVSYFGIRYLAFDEGSVNSEQYIKVLESHF